MKSIYEHEIRDLKNPTFIHLLKQGLVNTGKLKYTLNNQNFVSLFSSPFKVYKQLNHIVI